MSNITDFYLGSQKRFRNSKFMNYYDEKLKKPFKYIGFIISWTIFLLLVVCAALLLYYFVSVKIYQKKGIGSEPPFGLYTIISPSMEPNLNVYDVAISKRVTDPKDIQIGDVITFHSSDFKLGQNIVVTHRITEIIIDEHNNYKYTTKGDNNFIQDPTPVAFESIIGKVSTRIPQLGRIQFFLASKFGWLVVVILPALLVIIKEILKLVKEFSPKVKNPRYNLIFNRRLRLPYRKRKEEPLIKIISLNMYDKKSETKEEHLSKIYDDLKDISD